MNSRDLTALRRIVEADTTNEFADEVMHTRVEGQDVDAHVKAYLDLLIVEGQKLHKLVSTARSQVGEYGPMSNREFRRAVEKVVAGYWGRDAMTQPLVNLVAFGDYVF
jgi:hypothetical protein